jgi:ribosomal protein S16
VEQKKDLYTKLLLQIVDLQEMEDLLKKVGFFNPLLPKDKKERVGLEAERIKYWLGQGAQPTTRVARIFR